MSDIIKLENDLFCREIYAGAGGVYTKSVFNKVSNREYNKRVETSEFMFSVNGDLIVSYTKPEIHELDGSMVEFDQMLRFEGYEFFKGSNESKTLRISMHCKKHNFMLHVCYQIYPDLPGCSKWLEIENHGDELHLSRMFFEQLSTCPGDFADSDFYRQQGMVPTAPMFNASYEDDIIQLHNSKLEEGLYIGNGACGPLRYFMVYPHWGSGISCGYNMSGADFNAYLKKGENFISDKAYLSLYEGAKDNVSGANAFREMIRRDLPECPDNGGVMYCTWQPFMKDINEELLLELVERAANFGFRYFVIDDGWFTDNDWEVDWQKFPNGLEVIADKVHEAGMLLGLWLNIGNDYGQVGSRAEDNATDFADEVKPFGFSTRGLKTRCFASKHRDIIADKLIKLAEKYKVDYYKLDFSNIVSPYGMMAYGCHSCDHEYHKGYSDAVYEQYQSMMFTRNKVKSLFPELIIDFSFEVFGTERPNIAAMRYSELHHASNMSTLRPEFTRADTIRRTLYEYANLLPNERLLGSLICLQNDNDIEHLLTAFVGTPLVAGDLTRIEQENADKLINIVKELNSLIAKGPLTEYELIKFKTAGTLNEWDGFGRYSREGNGIICLFQNDSNEDAVKVALNDFPAGQYLVKDMQTNQELMVCTSEDLRKGINVKWLKGMNCRALSIMPQ